MKVFVYIFLKKAVCLLFCLLYCLGEGHEGDVSEDRESKIFPESTSRNDVISCSALTPDFLIFGTDMGALHFFYLEDWTIVHEYR